MAKGKKKGKGKNGKALGTKTALGAGLMGGVASLVANKATGEVVKEAVRYGTNALLGSRKPPVKVEEDLGYQILKLVAAGPEPVRVARVAKDLKEGLLPVLKAVQMLRRGRYIKYGDGRRAMLLTPAGREALDILNPDESATEDDKPDHPGDSPVASSAETEVNAAADGD